MFAVDRKNRALAKLQSVASGGLGPNHAAVDATGKTLVYVNYRGSSVAALPIGADGALGAPRMDRPAFTLAAPPPPTAPSSGALLDD